MAARAEEEERGRGSMVGSRPVACAPHGRKVNRSTTAHSTATITGSQTDDDEEEGWG